MTSILVIGASSSKASINQQFATFAASQIKDATLNSLNLNDFEMPLYSIDKENDSGIPEQATQFINAIASSDGIVISLAEHNGSYSAAFKNLLDWASRASQKLWADKPMLLLASSPGGRGGQTVLDAAKTYFPYMGANVVASMSLPKFYDTFSAETGLSDPEKKAELDTAISAFKASLV